MNWPGVVAIALFVVGICVVSLLLGRAVSETARAAAEIGRALVYPPSRSGEEPGTFQPEPGPTSQEQVTSGSLPWEDWPEPRQGTIDPIPNGGSIASERPLQ